MVTQVNHDTRQQPAGAPAVGTEQRSQQAILEQVNNLAWLLDNSIRIPFFNYRIGLDAIVGLIPGLGDVAGALVSSYIVMQAMRLGAPTGVLVRMVGNVALEAVVGLIPLVGDLFDATFKANARNVQLLNAFFDEPTTNQILQQSTGKGAVAAITGALLGLLALVGGAGLRVFQRMARRYRSW